MAKRSSLRASDADRDSVADRLRDAAAEGRLLAHEFEERLATALRARTYGELDAVIEDLPTQPPAGTGSRRRRPAAAWSLAVRHPLAAAMLMCVAGVLIASMLAAVAVVVACTWLLLILLMPNRRGGMSPWADQRVRTRGYVRHSHVDRYPRFY